MSQPRARALGNYVLGPLLGRGGMGAVYAGEHRFLGDRVAVKLLHAHLAADEAEAARFLREATATRAIRHPNVVRVLDFGRAEDDGALYLVMERVEGETLAARLRRGRLDEAEVRRIGALLADGLQAAHALGVVHRDVKPGNVLLGPGGAPTLVDFGIAKLLGAEATRGGAVGTLEYTPPEQLGRGVVGPHSDIYALGVTLFEMATGALPFTGFDGGGAPQLFTAPRRPGSLAPLSPELEALILQCLELEPARRPASMAEVRDRLRGDAFERDTRPPLERDTEALTAPPPVSRSAAAAARAGAVWRTWARRGAWAALVALALVAVGLGLRHLWRARTAPPVTARMPAAATAPIAPRPIAPAASAPSAPAATAPIAPAATAPIAPAAAAPPIVAPAATAPIAPAAAASPVVAPPAKRPPPHEHVTRPHRKRERRSPVYHQSLD